ncbi:hypothetical protein [Actinomadura opuntiae]|uniref:hypothetical protein n=1 Tax=Actinomadura sp. OS1-43 TaxID=604315 RepID=UPI00255ABFED|nr:hypothetical protein [Actinomadura sp. OS1-43]MDL4821727.1 hypothetical protein [Actinomadura sp. OS1-43]
MAPLEELAKPIAPTANAPGALTCRKTASDLRFQRHTCVLDVLVTAMCCQHLGCDGDASTVRRLEDQVALAPLALEAQALMVAAGLSGR